MLLETPPLLSWTKSHQLLHKRILTLESALHYCFETFLTLCETFLLLDKYFCHMLLFWTVSANQPSAVPVANDVVAPSKIRVVALDVFVKGHFHDELILLSLSVSVIVLIFRVVGLIEVDHVVSGRCLALVSLCKLFHSILLLIQEHSLVAGFLRVIGEREKITLVWSPKTALLGAVFSSDRPEKCRRTF